MRLSYSTAVKWTAPLTNKLLWDAGISQYFLNYTFVYLPGAAAYQNMGNQDLTLSTRWGARPEGLFHRNNYKRYHSASLAYVTGSHAIKGGIQYNHAVEDSYYNVDPWHMVAQFRNGVPSTVLVDNTPVYNKPGHDESGLFFQDSWTLKRLTINPGIRYDWFHPWVAQQTAPGSPWLPERHFDGDRRHAVVQELVAAPRRHLQPVRRRQDGRQGECRQVRRDHGERPGGPLQPAWRPDRPADLARHQRRSVSRSTAKSDRARSATSAPAPHGSRIRMSNARNRSKWSASVQHQLLPRMSVTAGYYHRMFYDLRQTENTLVDVNTDYTPVQIADPRGGGQTITIYNLNPAKFGQTNLVDTTSKTNRLYWDGIDLSAQGRIGDGGRVYGGASFGGTSQNMCDVVDPNFTGSLGDPGLGQPVLRAVGAMEAAVQVRRQHAAALRHAGERDAQQLPGQFVEHHLRRHPDDLSGAGADVAHGAARRPVEPGSVPAAHQSARLRFAKKIALTGSKRMMLQFDIFNAFNSNPVLAAVTSYRADRLSPEYHHAGAAVPDRHPVLLLGPLS